MSVASFLKRRCKAKPFPGVENGRYRYRDGSPLPLGSGYHPHASTRFANYDGAGEACRLPELYSRREECCGCTACVFSCPKGAIGMEGDEEGFLYPVVDASLCVGCGRCVGVCAFKNTD